MSELPRLLLCAFDVIPAPTGLSRRVTEYVRSLTSSFNVVVLGLKTPDHSHIERYLGARMLRVPVGQSDLVTRIEAFERAVRRQLDSEAYAAIQFFDPFSGYSLCERRDTYGYRLVYDAQSFPSSELPYSHRAFAEDRRFLAKVRRQELFCLMNADAVVTGSAQQARYIHSLGVPTERVRVLRAPTDVESFRSVPREDANGPVLRLVYLGNHLPHQGWETLLQAVTVAQERTPVSLTLVGPRHPDWSLRLEERISALGLGAAVRLEPPVPHPELPRLLARFDVGVLPLGEEERNRVQGGALAKTAEYLASGLPVIASDLPVTRSLLPEGCALLYPPGDANTLAARMVELAEDPDHRSALARNAQDWALEHLRPARLRDELLLLHRELGKLPRRAHTPMPMPEASEESAGTSSEPTQLGLPAPRPSVERPSAKPAPTRTVRRDLAARPQPASRRTLEEAAITDPHPLPPPSRPPPLVPARGSAPARPVAAGWAFPPSSTGDEAITEVGVPARTYTGESAVRVRAHQAAPVLPPPPSPKPPAAPVSEGFAAPSEPTEIPAAPSTWGTSGGESAPPASAPGEPSERTLPRAVAPSPFAPGDTQPHFVPPMLSLAGMTPSMPEFQRRPTGAAPVSPPSPPMPAAPSTTAPPSAAAAPPLEVPAKVGASTQANAAPSAPPPLPRNRPPAPAANSAPDTARAPAASTVTAPSAPPAVPVSRPSAPKVTPPAFPSPDRTVTADVPVPIEVERVSALDPWFAQLAHGYCPPDASREFARHTPPTNFPGREKPPGELKPTH